MEVIYQQHAQTVYRYLLSLTRDENLSEELTQETF
jgi:RNA polymerase sigma-70 factor (ECF subfamily)